MANRLICIISIIRYARVAACYFTAIFHAVRLVAVFNR